MLHVQKNQLITGLAKSQVEIRQLEIDWYCGNYATITGQAAMLAGFAFSQLTTPMPEGQAIPFVLEFFYLFLTCVAIGLELSAIILSSCLSVWAPSLALKGKRGAADLHKAVDCLKNYQFYVFMYFIIGWILFFVSNICQIWIYFRRRIAVVVTIPMLCFICAILWYAFSITYKLRLDEDSVVTGKIDHFAPYEGVGDLDHGLSTAGPSARLDSQSRGYCPVHESFQPRLAAERAARDLSQVTQVTMPGFGGPASSTMMTHPNRRLLQQS